MSSSAVAAAVCADPVALNLWHPVAAVVETAPGAVHETRLLEEALSYAVTTDGGVHAWRSAPSLAPGTEFDAALVPEPLQAINRFGYLWTSYGSPPDDLFDLPEFHEPDRRNVWGGTIGVHTSAPRAVENFLDMGHFPYVHTGYLGIEPHTEVADYDVDLSPDGSEVVATRCRFFQPMGAVNASGGMMVGYVYRVPHPYCAVLYKSNSVDESRNDAITIFCQPIDEVTIRAHMLLSMLDDASDDRAIKRFQLLIFGQDKPILENQHPRRLPLEPRAETPIRSDKMSIAYRRWLADMGLTYGVTPPEGSRGRVDDGCRDPGPSPTQK